MRFSSFSTAVFFVAVVRGHGAITKVTGANGVNGAAFGIIADTPRDGSSPRPFEQDTSVIRQASGAASCGKTKAGGVNDIATNLASASAAGLPSTTAAGDVEMTLHQVNQDGAGPYTCDVSADGSGLDFTPMTVKTNVKGFAGLSLAKASDFPLVATMPPGTSCTGGPQGNACIVRCKNKALAGPFGGCVAVTMGATAAGNSTATTTAATETDTSAAGTADASTADTGTTAGADGLGGVLGGLFGGFGKFGGGNKRMIKSRIVARQHVGRWI